MHLNYHGPVSRIQSISCFSSFWIPLRAHHWVPLPGLVACWWATLIVYWNGWRCSFFIGMHAHRNTHTQTPHTLHRCCLHRALCTEFCSYSCRRNSDQSMSFSCHQLPGKTLALFSVVCSLGPLQLGIYHFADPLFTAPSSAPGRKAFWKGMELILSALPFLQSLSFLGMVLPPAGPLSLPWQMLRQDLPSSMPITAALYLPSSPIS